MRLETDQEWVSAQDTLMALLRRQDALIKADGDAEAIAAMRWMARQLADAIEEYQDRVQPPLLTDEEDEAISERAREVGLLHDTGNCIDDCPYCWRAAKEPLVPPDTTRSQP